MKGKSDHHTHVSRSLTIVRHLTTFRCLLLLLLTACSGGLSDPMPVSLPVPFSGALDGNSRVVVADGQPIHTSFLKFQTVDGKTQTTSASTGDRWTIFNDDGSVSGTVTYSQITPFTQVQNETQFSFTANFQFADGSWLQCVSMQCHDFPFKDEGDPNSNRTKGVCNGVVQQGGGEFSNARGNLCAHRYVYENNMFGGLRSFGAIDQGVWILKR